MELKLPNFAILCLVLSSVDERLIAHTSLRQWFIVIEKDEIVTDVDIDDVLLRFTFDISVPHFCLLLRSHPLSLRPLTCKELERKCCQSLYIIYDVEYAE